MIYRICLIALITVLTACQNFPGIFQPDTKKENTATINSKNTASATINTQPNDVITESADAIATKPATPDIAEGTSAAPANLWSRFQTGLVLEYANQANVQKNIDWYIKNRYILERSQERIAYYLYFIMDELEKQDIPFDVALIPLIESQYNPFASSGLPAGMWQFMPGTGRRFNLVSSYWYDGRRDPVESTKAVATYFRYLMNYFNNDLLLALAAYNSGEGTVQNAIDRNIRAGKPTDFWHLNLPAVTTNYIPKIVALAEIYKHPEKYNLTLNPVMDKAYFSTIKIDSDISLEQVSEALQIPQQEMYYLNAGIRRNTRPNHERYVINIPTAKMEGVWDRLEKIPQKNRIYVTQHKHLVKSGDTLGSIASKYNVSVQQLKHWNHLRSDIIVAGKTLHIATPPSAAGTIKTIAKAPATVSATLPPKKSVKTSTASPIIQHRVKSGESLWKIAQTYKVKVDSLAKWNKKSAKSALKPGEILIIYTNAKR